MIFVLKMLFTLFYDREDENHWSCYSLFVTHYSLLRIQAPPTRLSIHFAKEENL